MKNNWMMAAGAAVVLILGIRIAENVTASDGLSCPAIEKVNRSKYEWNVYDSSVMKGAQISCGFKYRNSPCLVRFEKYGMQDYNVTCGAKR